MTGSGQRRGRWWFFRAGLLGLALLTCATLATTAPLGEPEWPSKADRVRFKATLGPSDVFADGNVPGAELKNVVPGDVITLTITGTPAPGFHTFPLHLRTEKQPPGTCTLTYDDNPNLTPQGAVLESEPESILDPSVGVVYLEYEKPFTWTQNILVDPKATPGATTLHFRLKIQACDKGTCVINEHDFYLPVIILDPVQVSARVACLLGNVTELNPLFGLTAFLEPSPVPDVDSKPERSELANKGLLGFLLLAVGFGFVSLLTPCVFPMIPITVSYFLEQAELKRTAEHPERKPRSPLLLALIYSGTIVAVLTLAGLFVIKLVADLSAHWVTNFLLGSLFVVFALSLFGMFEIVLPTWLVDLTSSRESKGGVVGTMFMALTFTLISFTCVAPFYGGFIGVAATASSAADWLKLFLGALIFSMAFASPFFLLALFPSFLHSLPKSGAWMNTLKVVMGFLELAAALKFFRSSEQFFFGGTSFFTYDLVLSGYVVLAVLCGLYLLNLYKLPHDHGKAENLGVLQLMFATGFITLGLYLAPGLFTKNPEELRQRGSVFSWVDAFLLRDSQSPSVSREGSGTAVGELRWLTSLDKGLAEARQKKRRVFIDFTGIVCSNCRYNENTVFTRPEIKNLMEKYVLVQLYTDGLPAYVAPPPTAAENRKLQGQWGDLQLPFYVIVDPTVSGFKKVAEYGEGKINHIDQFEVFLKKYANQQAQVASR